MAIHPGNSKAVTVVNKRNPHGDKSCACYSSLPPNNIDSQYRSRTSRNVCATRRYVTTGASEAPRLSSTTEARGGVASLRSLLRQRQRRAAPAVHVDDDEFVDAVRSLAITEIEFIFRHRPGRNNR